MLIKDYAEKNGLTYYNNYSVWRGIEDLTDSFAYAGPVGIACFIGIAIFAALFGVIGIELKKKTA